MSRNAGVGAYALITRQVVLDFPSMLTDTTATLPVTEAALGLPVGSLRGGAVVAVSPVGDLEAGLAVYGRGVDGGINVTLVNATSDTIDPVSRTFSVGIMALNTGL